MRNRIRRSLSAKLIIILGVPLLALLIFVSQQFLEMDGARKEERSNYCEEIHNGVYKQLVTEFSTIENTAAALSHSNILQTYMLGDQSFSQQLSYMSSIKEMIRLSSRFNTELIDIMLYANSESSVESLLGYCPREVRIFVKYRASVLRENGDVGAHNYFFQTLDAINNPGDIGNRFIIRIAPVFSTSPSGPSQRLIGHVAVVCAMQKINQILHVSPDVYCELRGAKDGFVLLTGDYYANTEKPDNVLVTDSRNSFLPGRDFELITYCYNTIAFTDSPPITLLVGAAFVAVYLIFLFIVVNSTILKPVQIINHEISKIGESYASKRLSVPGEDEMGSIVLHINQMLESIGRLNENVLLTQKSLYEAQIEKSKSQLYAFQSQVAPHFLFNTLQCIRSKAFLSNEPEIAEMCGDVSATLRYVLSSQETVTLKDELDISRRYLKIVSIRFQSKIRYEITVDANVDLNCPIPKMIIQPLVENAVYHGLEPLEGDGMLSIAVVGHPDCVEICLTDNGIGVEPETLNRLQSELARPEIQPFFTRSGADNIGLLNVHNRIRLRFGNRYGLSIDRRDGFTLVTIRLPLSVAEPR